MIASPAHSLEQYRCVVQDFSGFGHEGTLFERQNLANTYEILRNCEEIIVFMKSKEFQNSEYVYHIVDETFTEWVAFERDSNLTKSLIIPKSPEDVQERQGYFHVTMSLQGSFLNNAWLLRCAQ